MASSGASFLQMNAQALCRASRRPASSGSRRSGCGRAPRRPALRRSGTAAPQRRAPACRDIAARPSENSTASYWPVGSDRPMMPILLPVLVRRSVRDTTVAATRPAVAPPFTALRKLRPALHLHALERRGVIVERMAGEEKADRFVFAPQPLGRQPRLDRPATRSARARAGAAEQFALPDRRRLMRALRLAQHRIDHRRTAARGCRRTRRRRRPRAGFPARAC